MRELQQIMSKIGAGSEYSVVSAVLRRYRPLSVAVLDAVCEHGPLPATAARRYRANALALRDPRLSPGDAAAYDDEEFRRIEDAVRRRDPGHSASRAAVVDPGLPPLPPEVNPAAASMPNKFHSQTMNSKIKSQTPRAVPSLLPPALPPPTAAAR